MKKEFLKNMIDALVKNDEEAAIKSFSQYADVQGAAYMAATDETVKSVKATEETDQK